MYNNSITTHQDAITVNWRGKLLVVEAKLNISDKNDRCIDIAFTGALYEHAKEIVRLVGEAMGYRLGSMSMGFCPFNRLGNWRDVVRATNIETGNGRYYVSASIIAKVPPPCPNCKVTSYANKPWGKTCYHCNMCNSDYDKVPAYICPQPIATADDWDDALTSLETLPFPSNYIVGVGYL